MSTNPGQPKRRGLALTIIGALLMFVVAPGIFVAGVVFGVKGAYDIVQSSPIVGAQGTVPMAAGQTRDIYAFSGPADSNDTGVETSTTSSGVTSCTVQDPSGARVDVTSSSGSTAWTRGGNRYVMAGSFTATTAGDYRVDCGDRDMLLPDGKDAKNAGEKAVTGIGGGLIIASIAGLIGLIMLIVGIVKLVNSGRERSQFRIQQQAAQWNPGGYRGY